MNVYYPSLGGNSANQRLLLAGLKSASPFVSCFLEQHRARERTSCGKRSVVCRLSLPPPRGLSFSRQSPSPSPGPWLAPGPHTFPHGILTDLSLNCDDKFPMAEPTGPTWGWAYSKCLITACKEWPLLHAWQVVLPLQDGDERANGSS